MNLNNFNKYMHDMKIRNCVNIGQQGLKTCKQAQAFNITLQ